MPVLRLIRTARSDDDPTGKSATDRTPPPAFPFDQNRLRLTRDFSSHFNLFRSFKPQPQKIFLFHFPEIRVSFSSSRLDERGVRVVTNAGRGCDGRARCRTTSGASADGQVVWSRSPDAGVKLADDESEGDGGYQARHSRESTKQPLKPLRRECRLYRLNLW